MYLIFDTETTGLPRNKTAPLTDLENWPRLVQLAWQLHDGTGMLLAQQSYIVSPAGFDIPFKAEQIHGISTQRALQEGLPIKEVLPLFLTDIEKTQVLIGHNIEFDISVIGSELIRAGFSVDFFLSLQRVDTGLASIEFCQLPGGIGGKLKIPRLSELYEKLFHTPFPNSHHAAFDVEATAKSFFELLKNKIIAPVDDTPLTQICYQAPTLSNIHSPTQAQANSIDQPPTPEVTLETLPFVHLHTHSKYSILQAVSDVSDLVAKAKNNHMEALALTDLGNLYGAFNFVDEAFKNHIKPIVGCEFFVSEARKTHKFTKENPDKRFQQVLLAKNKIGYQNLTKLSSIGFIEGLYGIYPRIDKQLISKYKEGLIATTGSLAGEIPYLILHVGERQAEESFNWWLTQFGRDFYIELNRHGTPEENRVNETLLKFAHRYHVKYFAANECFYIQQEQSNANDVLLCIKEGEFQSAPIGTGRGTRYGLPNDQFYFKSQEEMNMLFRDLPEAIKTTSDIVNKIESYELKREVVLPKFSIPTNFNSEFEYLKHLTYEGAKKKYPEITPELIERIDFELETIQKTGYPGYFLIVQDFTSKAREMGVSVGPGRGSAAGSVVAFCMGITNVDPISYNLLFERFLNPDRVSLPDIDIDFDDENRPKVVKYVVEKYGYNQVAQIITYGTMAAKSSIRDCARVMELPLDEANKLAKLVPERPGITLAKAFEEVKELRDIRDGNNLKAEVLKQAVVLEGSLRNTGTHACGIIVTPSDITQFIPVAIAKDSTMLVSQFDNTVVEQAGMLKMDFLGLTTLSVINTALQNIKKNRGLDIDINQIPLTDEKTYQLYQRGETTGTFQFESDGMQAYLKALKPDKFEDLIAMNALYRPGPMEYIPTFIARKRGFEKIQYDLPEMEEYLKDTYGVTVYQEQVMLLSQKLANFSKGDTDVLRKAIGKKQKDILNKMKSKFIEGCMKNNHHEQVAEKIWKDWESFAQYAFNKSHSTCYSLIAYQTAYLKANFTAEYMAAVLTHSKNNLNTIRYFIEECRKQNIEVLGPHINESGIYFEVNPKGEIRFGLGAIKGAGDAAVNAIINERETNGSFKDLFDFAKRLNQRSVNKKTFECLALSGAFDCFTEYHRRQYVAANEGDLSLIEKVIKYSAKLIHESQSAQASLFGVFSSTPMPPPKIEAVEPFSELEKLNFEKEVVGVYISGHPLDNFQLEMAAFCNNTVASLTKLDGNEGKKYKVGGMVSSVEHRMTKNGRPFGRLSIEDYSGKNEIILWSDDYIKYKSFLTPGLFLFIEGQVLQKKWGDKNLEFKIQSIDLLNKLAEKKIQGIAWRCKVSDVTSSLIDTLKKICKKNMGDVPLYVYLEDEEEMIQTELLARNTRIMPNNQLIKELKKWVEVGILTDKLEVKWLQEQKLTVPSPEGDETISPLFVLDDQLEV